MRHEMRLAAVGLKFTLFAAVVVSSVAAAAGGSAAAFSALAAAGICAANHLAASLSVGMSRTFDANVAAFAWGSWGMRMAFVAGSFIALAEASWIHTGWAAAAFVLCMFTALAAECRAWATKSYVPAWRMAR